jgi:hypothetical protein
MRPTRPRGGAWVAWRHFYAAARGVLGCPRSGRNIWTMRANACAWPVMPRRPSSATSLSSWPACGWTPPWPRRRGSKASAHGPCRRGRPTQRKGQDKFRDRSGNHLALAYWWSMIFFRKSVSTFQDHALRGRRSAQNLSTHGRSSISQAQALRGWCRRCR